MLRINNFVNNIEFISAQDAKDPIKDLKKTAHILNKYNLKWHLSFGTALGFYRDKGFIKGDTDIDINIMADDTTPVDTLIDEFTIFYYLVRSVMFKGKQMQLAFQGDDKFIIDLCFFYPNENGVYSYCEGGMWQDQNYNIRNLKTKYGKFPIPTPIEEYLTDRYGDWKTPQYGETTQSIKA